MAKPFILLWLDAADRFGKAIERTELAQDLEFSCCSSRETPPDTVLERADAVVCWDLPAGMIRKMKNLRWIQCQSVGVEKWLAREDLSQDIVLTGTRGVHRTQMPDTILGSLYDVTKPFDVFRQQQAQGLWNRIVPGSLHGKTLGIVGLGAIGSELARKANALDMRVIGIKRTEASVPGVERIYGIIDINALLRQSDYVVLLIPATAETRNLINAKRLSEMKTSAWLLNFARGDLIVDQDLIEAVETGRIAGAVLDAFREEPLAVEHPFWRTKNVRVYPHIGGLHPDRESFVITLFLQNLAHFLRHEDLQSKVDRDRGY